jgi:hypothetical protein
MGHVPTSVYILFFVLLYLGIKRCVTRVISIERMAVFPVIFIFMSLRGTINLLDFTVLGFFLLAAGAIVGIILGHIHVRNRTVRADRKNHLIEIPGDISMLAMVLSIFFIEFFIHYAVDANWHIAQLNIFKISAVIVSGVVVGVSVGRNISYFNKYLKADSVVLTK